MLSARKPMEKFVVGGRDKSNILITTYLRKPLQALTAVLAQDHLANK